MKTCSPLSKRFLIMPVVAIGLMALGSSALHAEDKNVDQLIRQLQDRNAMKQRRAAEALQKLGPAAAKAVPALLKTITTDYEPVQLAAVKALGAIGEKAVPGLIGTMGKKRAYSPAAAKALGLVGRPAVKPLIAYLKKKLAPEVRTLAISALGGVGADAAPAVDLLQRYASDASRENIGARREAFRTLGKIGLPARAAFPLLLKFARDERMYRGSGMWHALLEALASLGPADPKTAVDVLGLCVETSWRDRAATLIALRGLQRLGSKAASTVPRLLPLLVYESGSRKALTLGREGRLSVLRTLGAIGPAARDAVPSLIRELGSADHIHAQTTVEALIKIGKVAIPRLETSLDDTSELVRFNAVRVLGGMGEKGLPGLRKAINDSAQAVKVQALEQLGNTGPAAIPLLSKMLKNPDRDLRIRTLKSLRRIGPAALPVLVGAFEDKDAGVRQEAIEQAAAVGKAGVPVLAGSVQKGKTPAVRLGALSALRRIGRDANGAARACQAALADSNEAVRIQAARTLMLVGGGGLEKAVPLAVKSLKDPSKEVRAETCRALGMAGPKAVPAVPDLVQCLKDENFEVCSAAAKALGRIGPGAGAAAEPLAGAIAEDRVWHAGVVALNRLGKSAHVSAPRLIAALQQKANRHVRVRAAQALGEIKPPVKEAIPALINIKMTRRDNFFNQICINALSNIGKVAVPQLIEALGHKDGAVRGRCAAALGQIGPEARAAVPALIKFLQLKYKGRLNWDGNAVVALGRIGPAAAPAVDALMAIVKTQTKYVNDHYSRGRSAAVLAIGGIGKPAVSRIPELRGLFKKERDGRVKGSIEKAIRLLDAAADRK